MSRKHLTLPPPVQASSCLQMGRGAGNCFSAAQPAAPAAAPAPQQPAPAPQPAPAAQPAPAVQPNSSGKMVKIAVIVSAVGGAGRGDQRPRNGRAAACNRCGASQRDDRTRREALQAAGSLAVGSRLRCRRVRQAPPPCAWFSQRPPCSDSAPVFCPLTSAPSAVLLHLWPRARPGPGAPTVLRLAPPACPLSGTARTATPAVRPPF